MNNVEDILNYFASDKGFERLLNYMFDSFSRYGRAFGAVRLTRPTPDEESALSEFFKRDYYNQAMIRIGLADFERQVQKTFNASIKLSTLLEGFSGKSVVNRKDIKTGASKYSDEFTAGLFTQLLPKYKNTIAGNWIGEVAAHMRRTYRPWVELHHQDSSAALKMIDVAALALNEISANLKKPSTPEKKLIPIEEFAAKFLPSPYGFEFSEKQGQLLLRALAFYFHKPITHSLDDNINLYVRAGILANGVLSRVTVRGINAIADNGKPDDISKVYNKLNQAHMLTLENLNRLPTVSAVNNRAFVIESPAVYSAVCERLRDVNCTVICPVGHDSPALLFLLKKLVTGGASIYYAGNMDYKGLAIADKLYLEFGKSFVPWRYNHSDYDYILGEEASLLPDEKRGLALHNETLASLLSLIRKVGKTAPAMKLAPKLAEDIRELMK